MPRKSTTSKGASGTGSIRKITTTRNGKQYTYWQAGTPLDMTLVQESKSSVPYRGKRRRKYLKS